MAVGHAPEEDSQDQEVPEQVDALEEKDGNEDLPLHPTNYQPAVSNRSKCTDQ